MEGLKGPLDVLDELDRLKKLYGGIDNIPEDELEKIGYYRSGPGSITKLGFETAKDLFEANGFKFSKEKSDKIPFERIDIALVVESQATRYLDEEESKKVLNAIQENFSSLYNKSPKSFLQENIDKSSFFKLWSFILEDLKQNEEGRVGGDREISSLLVEDVFFYEPQRMVDGLSSFLYVDGFGPGGSISRLYDYYDDDLVISRQGAQKLLIDLERVRGQSADVGELEKSFEDYLQRNIFENDDSYEFIDDLIKYLEDNQLFTNFDLAKHIFIKFLRKNNFDDLAEELALVRDRKDLIITLDNYKNTLSPDLHQEEIELKKKFSNSSPEEKSDISVRLKEIKKIRQFRKHILNGLKEWVNYPRLLAGEVNKAVRDSQNLLISSGPGNKGEIDLTLIGTPDIKLDTDPGALSGDCTKGRPLPFADHEIPVFNIKVFKFEKHVGNIYLLVTEAFSSEGAAEDKVWHLDAIQIPSNFIWEPEHVKILVEALSIKALEKDITFITTNTEDVLISNYDYISSAVLEFQKTKNLPPLHIRLPSIDDGRFSNFQGDSLALILWQKA